MRVLSTMFAAGVAPLLIAAQAPVQGQPNGVPQTGDEVSSDYKVVCKKFPPPTGTRMRARKICKTLAEWTQTRHDEREAIEDLQRRNGLVNN